MASGDRVEMGSVREKWYFLDMASKYIRAMPSPLTLLQPEHWMPPSRMDLDGSGMTRVASGLSWLPRPEQSGHAP